MPPRRDVDNDQGTTADDEEVVNIRQIPDEVSESMLRSYAAQAMQKFPDEWRRIANKYGSVEYVISEDGTTVTGVAEPKGFLGASDRIELERLAKGEYGINRAQRPLSSHGLRLYAEGYLSKAIQDWERLKTDGDFLFSEIVKEARYASETHPDKNGKSPTPEELLSKPRFVAMKLRYLVHNTALAVADWSTILEYFKDIERLDAKYGRFGALEIRKLLMSQVKKILGQVQEKQFRNFRRYTTFTSFLKPCVVREKDHPDYAGALVALNGSRIPDFNEIVLEKDSLRGCFARMWVEGVPEHFMVVDFADTLGKASDSEKAELPPPLLDAWGDLQLTLDIIALLGTDGEKWETARDDVRYVAHAKNCSLSSQVINDAMVDKEIKSAESVRSESRLRKIWAELDRYAKKKAKKPLDQILAYAPVVPSWTHRPRVTAPTPEEKSATEDAAKDTETRRRKNKEQDLPSGEREPEPVTEAREPTEEDTKTTEPPIKPKPVSYTPVVSSKPEDEVPERKGPKVKTRGMPSGPSTGDSSVGQVSEVTAQADPTIYHVGKKVYDTLRRLLVKNEAPMDWIDFEKALGKLEFSMVPRGGSKVVFFPPTWANASPLFVHRPHGQNGNEIHPKLAQILGSMLKNQYGWTLEWFRAAKGEE